MSILLKAYIISIIFYIIGFVIVALRITGYCEENMLTKEKHHMSIYTKLSGIMTLIVYSLIPVFNIIVGGIFVFRTDDLVKRAIRILEENND